MEKNSWFQSHTQRQVLLFAGAWFISSALVLASQTIYFTQSPFKAGPVVLGLVVFNTIMLIRLVKNYYRGE